MNYFNKLFLIFSCTNLSGQVIWVIFPCNLYHDNVASCKLKVFFLVLPPMLLVVTKCYSKLNSCELVSTSHNLLPQLAKQVVICATTLFNLRDTLLGKCHPLYLAFRQCINKTFHCC